MALLALAILVPASNAVCSSAATDSFEEMIGILSKVGDRSTGSPGAAAAAKFIKKKFKAVKPAKVFTQRFSVPVKRDAKSVLYLPEKNLSIPISPLKLSAITPQTIGPQGLSGSLIYVNDGTLKQFNGKTIKDSIILMELASGGNWLNAASLGAQAVIYIDRGQSSKFILADKMELSPIQFPRFWLPLEKARELFGSFEIAPDGQASAKIKITSQLKWENAAAENIYALIEGSDPKLKEELLIVEAFYDSTALVSGQAPGADEATGIATLLELAKRLKNSPPQRSVLLAATAGHAQSLYGMREMVATIRSKKRDLRKRQNKFKRLAADAATIIKALGKWTDKERPAHGGDVAQEALVRDALIDRGKTEVDILSRRLMRLRLSQKKESHQAEIKALAKERMVLRRLGWRKTFDDLPGDEKTALGRLLAATIADQKAILTDAKRQRKEVKSALAFRKTVKEKELVGVVSLHLSSHGDGIGAFSRGYLYPLKPTVDRAGPYRLLNDVLNEAAAATAGATPEAAAYHDTLRPSGLRQWGSFFLDKPAFGGEVSALAGYLGFTLATTHDARHLWGTPHDRPDGVDRANAARQSDLVCGLVAHLLKAKKLHEGILPRRGFAEIYGRAKFLRHGELFADQPAPGSVLMAYQGESRHYAIVDTMGGFVIKGVADKKHVIHKVILEGYRFDTETGVVKWAIDKKQTGKSAYRVKMTRRRMETDLIMFTCRQTTMFNLLEPRTFNYMTRIQLIDGKRETWPLKYWFSRVDTRKSTIVSTFLEPGTRLKFTLSDSIINKKMILTNATPKHPQGSGYLVDEWPVIQNTGFRVAGDMWQLLRPRIANLEKRGIYNARIRQLAEDGTNALKGAQKALDEQKYDRFSESSAQSWALASQVYNHVEKTQKDVLFGVLFYIALFVPFAFCMERLLFAYTNIYKRIAAFMGILILLIAVIYNVHPAFQLAYSPMVVILAFFIIGLSFMVTLILFLRFEAEMVRLQSHASKQQSGDISYWKAFVAAFFLGISNLRRRRLRTALTCITLIILTFTIMSFTSVKSMRRHGRLAIGDQASYHGLLLKKINWETLPAEAYGVIQNALAADDVALPRAWLESEDRTQPTQIFVRYGKKLAEAQGLVGLVAAEGSATDAARILKSGRWFEPHEDRVVLLPARMALLLGIDVGRPDKVEILLWGMAFKVVGIFDGQALEAMNDLDGEPLTPVTFPTEMAAEMTEVELEALESGDDMRSFQSRYRHVAPEQTIIIPYRTLLAAGGRLKAVAIKTAANKPLKPFSEKMADRFGLSLFSGEKEGTFLYNVSDAMNYSGVPNIVIPLIISIFIVLNTMIGSVYERKREIGIYTSVGLAPSHVSFLFIAEAMAFAVISVVLGYLLAQTSAKLFAATPFWAGLTVNYSSLSGVGAMVLVILVVLISVLYPSKVAAEIAIPDVNRTWQMPEATGNMLEVTLPFLMQYKEYRSIGGYLYDYFKGHQDISHGLFSTGEVQLRQQKVVTSEADGSKDAAMGQVVDVNQQAAMALDLTSQVWLAPFDFGIRQQVEIALKPSKVEAGYLEIQLRLIRQSGEANAWRRINKGFLFELRKQLLIWRSLNDSAHRHYAGLSEANGK
jgi:hypothetical protein